MQRAEYKIKVYDISEILKLIENDKNIRKLYNSMKVNYLSSLSKKFDDQNITDIIQNDKSFYKSMDRSITVKHIICYLDDRPIGTMRSMTFGKRLKDTDFFSPLIKKYNAGRYTYLYSIYVLDKYRGKGAYKAMLNATILFCGSDGVNLIIMDIKDANTPSIGGAIRIGFKKTDIISRHFDTYFYVYSLGRRSYKRR